MVLTVSFELPGDRACLPPSSANMVCLHPLGPTRHPRTWRQRRGVRTTRLRRTLQHLSSARRWSLTGLSPTCPTIPSRAKRCRVHRPPPRVRDDHDTPLWWGGMRKVLDLIWGKWEQKYFSENQK